MLLRAFRFVLLLWPLAFMASKAQASNDNAWAIWKQDDVHAIMRHATAPGFGDPENFTLGQCDTQRNLNETGRREARALGQSIHEQGIELTAVYSSQWCRCLHTAEELKLGEVQELPILNSFFQE